MKRLVIILVIVIVIFVGLVINGAYTAYSHMKGDTSLNNMAYTYDSMNIASQQGYRWVMGDDMDLIFRIIHESEAKRRGD